MDLNVAKPTPTIREFLAVVLTGFGNELLPLTNDYGEEVCPKALLPVANKPLLDYTLTWAEQSGIKDILLICPSSHRAAISHYLHSENPTSLHVDVQTFDESQDASVGTCTLLRHFANRIPTDFVLLPCDFISPPSLTLTALLDKFRTESGSDGSIATTCWFERRGEKSSAPDEWGPVPPPVSIVWEESTGTLLYIDTPDDEDRNNEELELRMSMLSRYPQVKLSTIFQDSHVYVCKRSILDVLQRKRHLGSFREEFFPWLCKVQYQRTKRDKYAQVLNPITNMSSQGIALQHSTVTTDLSQTYHKGMTHHSRDNIATSLPLSPSGSDTNEYELSSLRIGIFVHRSRAGFATRVNTLASFLDANRYFLSQANYSLPTEPDNRALIDKTAQISSDSVIAAFTKVEERASIKKSIIGKHCVIGKTAKIVGCILLDHCVVGDGAKLEGCIFGKNTAIGPRVEIIRCVTQAGYEVNAGETLKNERLEVSDWAAAPESREEGENEDEDEDDDEED